MPGPEPALGGLAMRSAFAIAIAFVLIPPRAAAIGAAPRFHEPHAVATRVARDAAAAITRSRSGLSLLSDLPLVAVPAQRNGDSFAVFLSGDGGWAGLDREVATRLAAAGVAVVGLDSLRYFWKRRTPEVVAGDVERIVRHYRRAWRREHVVLVGYSFGADVLPFVVNRLAADLRAQLAWLVLIGAGSDAVFEVHVSGWIPGLAPDGEPLQPELDRLPNLPLLCLYGRGESASPCPRLGARGSVAIEVGEGHHLGGRYDDIANAILDLAHAPRPSG